MQEQESEEPFFTWEEKEDHVRITGCKAPVQNLVIPEKIHGLWVREVGDYAFRGMDSLEDVQLPASLWKLGDHVFFNCSHLEQLSLYDSLERIGDGALKNCDALSKVTLRVRRGHLTTLRLLLSDVMQDVRVRICYQESGGSSGAVSSRKSVTDHSSGASVGRWTDTQEVQLIFPAFYFDYIENYPARIFEEVIYGSGQAYRQCFRGQDLDYEAYDRLFERSLREDSVQVGLFHAVGRLLYPFRLTQERRNVYAAWLLNHGKELMLECLKEQDGERFQKILDLDLFEEQQVRDMLDLALAEKNAEYINLLMGYQGRRFGGRPSHRKRYVL